MKIEYRRIDDVVTTVVGEVYGDFRLETSKGNQLAIVMRDNTFEMNIIPIKGDAGSYWWRVDMERQVIHPLILG